MRRKLSALAHISEETTAETVIRDAVALIVVVLFIAAAAKGAEILGALVMAARLQ